MKYRSNRAKRRTETRENLLAAAASVICSVGYDGATLSAIAQAAGYTRGAIYSNFCSKESLVEELLVLHMQKIEADLDAIFSERGESVMSSLQNWLATSYINSNAPALIAEFQLLSLRDRAFSVQYNALLEAQIWKIARLIEQRTGVCHTDLTKRSHWIASTGIAVGQALHMQRLTLKPAAAISPDYEVNVWDFLGVVP